MNGNTCADCVKCKRDSYDKANGRISCLRGNYREIKINPRAIMACDFFLPAETKLNGAALAIIELKDEQDKLRKRISKLEGQVAVRKAEKEFEARRKAVKLETVTDLAHVAFSNQIQRDAFLEIMKMFVMRGEFDLTVKELKKVVGVD